MKKNNKFLKSSITVALALVMAMGNSSYVIKAYEGTSDVEITDTSKQEVKYALNVTNDTEKGSVKIYGNEGELTNGVDMGNNVTEYCDVTDPQIKMAVEAKDGYTVNEVKYNDTVVEQEDGYYNVTLSDNNNITVTYAKVEQQEESETNNIQEETDLDEDQTIKVQLLYLKDDGTVDPELTDTVEVKAGKASEMAESLSRMGKVRAYYKLSQTNGLNNIKVDDTIIDSACVVDGLVRVKTSDNQAGEKYHGDWFTNKKLYEYLDRRDYGGWSLHQKIVGSTVDLANNQLSKDKLLGTCITFTRHRRPTEHKEHEEVNLFTNMNVERTIDKTWTERGTDDDDYLTRHYCQETFNCSKDYGYIESIKV